MKNKRSFPWAFAVIALITIVAVVASLLPGTGLLPAPPTATPSATPPPTATGTPLPTDVCAPGIIEPVVLEFNTKAREFDDYYNIAAITPKQELTSMLTELQRVRRATEDYLVPNCLGLLKQLGLDYMNTLIESLLLLYNAQVQNVGGQTGLSEADVLAINQQTALGFQYHDEYVAELHRLLGSTATPTPSPTVAVESETPSP